MLQIDDSIVSFDLMEECFFCDLGKCKGACCVYGDSGAPLEKAEIDTLKIIYPKVKPYLTQKGIKAIEESGLYYIDQEDDYVTMLIDGKECAFSYFEDKICKCAIEKAYENGKIDFKKPVSCHLYPVRLTKYEEFVAVNFDNWDLCKHARILGKAKGIKLYQFLKEPLIRKFGESWYEEFCLATEAIEREKYKDLQ